MIIFRSKMPALRRTFESRNFFISKSIRIQRIDYFKFAKPIESSMKRLKKQDHKKSFDSAGIFNWIRPHSRNSNVSRTVIAVSSYAVVSV
jgi:hypothetical protein